MVEFNPDGSIKLPGVLAKKRAENDHRMTRGRCIRLRKDVISTYSPKSCRLSIQLSEQIPDGSFIEKVHSFFRLQAETPTKLVKLPDRKYEIEIGTAFRRCTECCQLINRYRQYLDGNIIEDKGTCTHKPREFSYEDHFD